MSAQGEDILAWLDAVITRREETARAATTGPWEETGIGDYGWTVSAPIGAIVETADSDQGRADAQHLALNNPVDVLRRCAADRKALTLYTETVDIRDRSAASIQAAQDRGGMPDPCVLDDWSRANREAAFTLPLIEMIAEGYGWTGGER